MQKITLEAARVNSGHTQQSLADVFGIDRSTIQAYENGKLKVKPLYLYALSSVSGFAVEDFIVPM